MVQTSRVVHLSARPVVRKRRTMHVWRCGCSGWLRARVGCVSVKKSCFWWLAVSSAQHLTLRATKAREWRSLFALGWPGVQFHHIRVDDADCARSGQLRLQRAGGGGGRSCGGGGGGVVVVASVVLLRGGKVLDGGYAGGA